MNWIALSFANFAAFTGRARRTELVIFVVFVTLVTLLAMYIDQRDGQFTPVAGGMEMATLISFLILICPMASLFVRRLHDSGRSGWWIMIFYIPQITSMAADGQHDLMLVAQGALLVGGVALVAMTLLPGEHGANRFGADPRAET
jgi:uncharacterized membrane protein YhaH (DUF805 family)